MKLNIWGLEITNIVIWKNYLTTIDTLGNKDEYNITGLEILDCSNNQLASLPTLPYGLKQLYCGGNQLTALPDLPGGLEILSCSGNNLAALPTLPEELKQLSCSENQLDALPHLPERLSYLYCYGNRLIKLPILPEGLISLNCFGNRLRYIQYLKKKPRYYILPHYLEEKHADGAYQRNYVLQTFSRYLTYFLIQKSRYYKTFRVFNSVLSESLL